MKFALIGERLGHSYSPAIHKKFGYEYDLVELSQDELSLFVEKNPYQGFNVTIPYKTLIMPLLDYFDETALEAGAVNTVVKREGKTCGYNTDIYGMTAALKNANIILTGKKVLILGSGGTAKTALAVCKRERAGEAVVISRKGENTYENIHRHGDAQVIINTTPVGMYPNTLVSPVDLGSFHRPEGVFDAIYNPLKTELLMQAEKRQIPYSNGLFMLVAQAAAVRNLFLGEEKPADIEKITRGIIKEKQNIVLVGMPGSGKTTIGKILAEKTGKTFVDIDSEIEKEEKVTIAELFSVKGEAYFRERETEKLLESCKKSGQVIASGGGAVLKEINRKAMGQNGVIIRINRQIDLLARAGRPLSQSSEKLKEMQQAREEYYKTADITVNNDGKIEKCVNEILEKIL